MQIVDAVEDISGGNKTIRPGTLYPILDRLEEQELISSRSYNGSTFCKRLPRQKFFMITKAGSKYLSEIQNCRARLKVR
jgi:DNA-binding PadR family transcriptional regulator